MRRIRIRKQCGGCFTIPASGLSTQVNKATPSLGLKAHLMLFHAGRSHVIVEGNIEDVREAAATLWSVRGELDVYDNSLAEVDFYGFF